jgi:hypothetical protein
VRAFQLEINMKHLICLLSLLCGCASYTQVQLDLVQQAEHGIELLAEHHQQQAVLIDGLHGLRRLRLDEAFDGDVRERAVLDAEWVIEHRLAYAATLDLLWQARVASLQAENIARDNAEATSDLLWQLRELLSRQRRALLLLRSLARRERE